MGGSRNYPAAGFCRAWSWWSAALSSQRPVGADDNSGCADAQRARIWTPSPLRVLHWTVDILIRNMPQKPSFEDAVRRVIRDLRRGEVVSYGEVARRAGYPRAARAVGNVLARGAGLPWWRVVRASGELAAHGRVEQERRLRREGVSVREGAVKSEIGSRKPGVGRPP